MNYKKREKEKKERKAEGNRIDKHKTKEKDKEI